jgi:hypothetical protein
MAGPIFDPLNPNESPATKYQRELDAKNKKGGGKRKRKKGDGMSDAEFDTAYEQQQESMPDFYDLQSSIISDDEYSDGGRVGKGKNKKQKVKKRNNFSGRGAGVALRGF